MIRLPRSCARSAPAATAIFLVLALPNGASAQYPTELSRCVPNSFPICFELGGGTFYNICSLDPLVSRVFMNFFGRVAWYPLQCVGPITVAIETYSPRDTRYPVYVEIVPLPASPTEWGRACANLVGNVVLIVYGHDALCGGWDEVGPLDITNVVPLGSLYAIRLYYLSNLVNGFSPALGCIRVTAYPVEPSPVAPTTWGHIKSLFQ